MNSIEYNFGSVLGNDYTTASGEYCDVYGPNNLQILRPAEIMGSAFGPIHLINNYLLIGEISTAAPTRRYLLYENDIFKGYITVNFPTITNHTIKDVRLIHRNIIYNAVDVSGTNLTSSGTDWSNLFPGSRFCLTATPDSNTTWYEISIINSNTSITATTILPTYSGPITINDMRILSCNTNATASNGGLFVIAGLRPEIFIPTGTSIPAATTTNIRGCYWIADASTVTNTTSCGLTLENELNNYTQYCYVLNGSGSTTAKIYKYNILGTFTGLTSGKTTNNFILATGTATTVGNISAQSNLTYANVSHGVGNNIPSLYFTTTSRVYRCNLSSITSGSTTFLSDFMLESTPGGTSSFPASGTIFSICYISSMDRFFINNTLRSYITQYYVSGEPFDQYFNVDYRNYNPGSINDMPFSVSAVGLGFYCFAKDNNLYLTRNSTSVVANQLYKVPVGLDYRYNRAFLKSPRLSFSATKLRKIFVETNNGSGDIFTQSEPYRVYWRNSGIEDDSGAWNLLINNDLSGISHNGKLQIGFDFNTFGTSCYSTQILGFCITYENYDTIPYELEWDIETSDIANGIVGFYQSAVFSPSLPTLVIRYHNSSNDIILFEQSSDLTSNGFFQYFDGISWVNGLGPNTIGTKRRFMPTSGLPNNTRLYVTLGTL